MSLYDQLTWDKYQLDRLAGDTFKRNTLIEETAAAAGDPANFEDPAGVFSPADNTIPALMRRGVVFLACTMRRGSWLARCCARTSILRDEINSS